MQKSFMLLPALTCVMGSAIAQTPVKPIVLTSLPLVGGGYFARTGQLAAAAARAVIARNDPTLKNKSKLMVGFVVPVPGIARVNDATSGAFEPGGAYDITGRDFGTREPSVFLGLNGRIIALDVVSWTDQRIVVSVPGDVSGLDDMAKVELTVVPPGREGFTSTRFGFRAARDDSDVPLDASMLNGRSVDSTRTQDGFFEMRRAVYDSGGVKRCFEPGLDTIMPPLRPGFELTGHVWYHAGEDFSKSGRRTHTPRGKYAFAYEGNGVRINYGVMRTHAPDIPLVWDATGSGCVSHYRVKLIATGPRGRPLL